MKYLILSLVVLLIVLSGCTQPIGGERDEHGCLGPAGYTWNQNVSACIREWELDENQKLAAKLAVDDLGYEYPTTIIEVEVARCPSCFIIDLEQGVNRDEIMITISNWTVVEKIITRHTCTEEEKEAEICTLEYLPVCGFYSNGTSRTYGNDCQACGDDIEYWEYGECEVNSFEKCVNAGNPILESYPRQCRTSDDITFTEEYCTKQNTTFTLTLANAKEIAIDSECGDRLKETYICNEFTGTYWIDLDIEKEGCNPACVIDLETREAEINWRCTGLLN
jgi:hypothetical protein